MTNCRLDDFRNLYMREHPDEVGYIWLEHHEDGTYHILGKFVDANVLNYITVQHGQYFFWVGPISEAPSAFITPDCLHID